MLTGYDTDRRGLDWVRSCLAGERAESGLAFNPLTGAFRRDPEPGYAELREHDPVHFSRLLDCWVVSRHREVEQVLRAPEVFRSDARSSTQDLTDPYVLLDPDRPSLFLVDPPDHGRLRAAVNDAFSRAAVERLRPRLARTGRCGRRPWPGPGPSRRPSGRPRPARPRPPAPGCSCPTPAPPARPPPASSAP